MRPGEWGDTKLTTFAFNCRDVSRNGGSRKTTTSQKFQKSDYMINCNLINVYIIIETKHDKHVEQIAPTWLDRIITADVVADDQYRNDAETDPAKIHLKPF